VGIKCLHEKSVLIFNDLELNKPSGAAFSRMLNYAKALTLTNDINVIFCSFQHKLNPEKLFEFDKNIFISGQTVSKKGGDLRKYINRLLYPFNSFLYLVRIDQLLYKINGEIVVLVFSRRLFNDIFLLIKFKLFKKKKIYVEKNELFHTIYLGDKYRQTTVFKRCIIYLHCKISYVISYLNDVLISYYHGVIVISRALDNWCLKYNRNKILIPILTDCELFKIGKETVKKREDLFIIGFTGSLNQNKDGLLYLLSAVNRLKNHGYGILLNLYGPVTKMEMAYFQKYITDKKIENIIFKGNFTYELLIKELNKHDLLIMPRPYSKQGKYGFATKLADYLASGIPVLTTNISDNTKYIKHGYNGFIIDYNDLDHLADSISLIMQNVNLDLIGYRGRLTAEECFDFRNYSKVLKNFLFDYESSNS